MWCVLDGADDRVDADPPHRVAMVEVVPQLDAEKARHEQREHDEPHRTCPARDRQAAREDDDEKRRVTGIM